MRIVSFNANGLRSATSKGFFEWMHRQKADVVCVQEIRAEPDQLERKARAPRGYFAFFHPAKKKGYSGVALYAKREPDRIVLHLGLDPWDREGRFLQADFGKLSVVSMYIPSGSSSEERQTVKLATLGRLLPYFRRWRVDGRDYVFCADWNIAHRPIDLKNWRSNQKNSGFLPEERAWLDELYDGVGLVDAFRRVRPEPELYTWWSNRGEAWQKNVGWRLDYQIVTPAIALRAVDAQIYTRKRFSDHAPLVMDYDLA